MRIQRLQTRIIVFFVALLALEQLAAFWFVNAANSNNAHAKIEESPAHLANVLAEALQVGVGVARGTLPSGAPAVYVTEILVQPPDDGRESALMPDARVREALWRERARLGHPPLTGDPALDALARDAAERMRGADAPDPGDLGTRALVGRGVAAVDVFVASAPTEAIRSRNLPDPRFRRVGVGVAHGVANDTAVDRDGHLRPAVGRSDRERRLGRARGRDGG